MRKRFTVISLGLAAAISFVIGLIVAGSLTPANVASSAQRVSAAPPVPRGATSIVVNFADVAERINPAVVNIDSTSRRRELTQNRRRNPHRGVPFEFDPFEFFHGPDGDGNAPRKGSGSGFIIDTAGFILTNNHVIENADRVEVRLSDRRTLRAKLIGADPDIDVALLKIDASDLPVAPLGDSDRLRVGEWVCAIGNPLVYDHTVTVGVVSYKGRKLFNQSLDDYIQTDAAINFGNSGGPLINTRGEVVGINAAMRSQASNIGFAVPINQARPSLEQLKTRGKVTRGWIGISLVPDITPDLQKSLGLKTASGALVQEVNENAPAARAGLRPYDLILAVDAKPVRDTDDLIRLISARPPGSTAHLKILRDGREQSVTITLAERPSQDELNQAQPPRPRDRDREEEPREPQPAAVGGGLGLTVRDLDRSLRQRYEIPATVVGVIVAGIEPVGPAADARLSQGDVITEINRQRITAMREYQAIVSRVHDGDALALYVYNPFQDRRFLTTIRVEGR